MSPEQARSLMEEWTQNPALRVHMETVAACLAAYAEKLAPRRPRSLGGDGPAA